MFNMRLSHFPTGFVAKKLDIFYETSGYFPVALVASKPEMFADISGHFAALFWEPDLFDMKCFVLA